MPDELVKMFLEQVIDSMAEFYLHCWKPSTTFDGGKYSLVALIEKSDTQTLEYVKTKSAAKWGGSVPVNCKMPIHDGDVEKPDNPIFRNCYYITAKSKQPPQIVDQNVEPLLNQSVMEMSALCFMGIMLAEIRGLHLSLVIFRK